MHGAETTALKEQLKVEKQESEVMIHAETELVISMAQYCFIR